ncbi:MAG: MFS transporter [Jaaginema sp. PMC 1079.18]|nr:MFS transporter [Jaaginema sp. PMC 1080.18]MEC4850651.1 MFS transporter [Jaaginema sp. PMC 1079.18]MEC4868386.1 MFS transporter [Jaaginema sp. PMC 1078.18]
MVDGEETQGRSPILWWRVGAIAGLQGAITLTWVLYGLYLPKLLTNMGLSADLALNLLIIEHLLEAFIEPLCGHWSDRAFLHRGHRLIIITVGVILASVFFISLPAIALFQNTTGIFVLLLPAMAIAWASAMAIFRSPALVLLNQTAPLNQLPQAASLLTFTSQLIASFRFVAYGAILSLGPEFAFSLGSIVLLIALAFLRQHHPPQAPSTPLVRTQKVKGLNLITVGITAIEIAWGLRFLGATLATVFKAQWGGAVAEWAMAGFFLTIAIASLPAGAIAARWSNRYSMVGGAIAAAIILLLFPSITSEIGLAMAAIALGCSFSFVLNGAIPYVLASVPTANVGLGLGFYFGAFGAAMSFFDLLFTDLIADDPMAIATKGVSALILVSCSVALTE